MFRTIILFVVLWIAGVHAADAITVESTVSANRISLTEVAQLTLTIHGGKGDIQPLELPPIDGLQSSYVGPSVRFAVVNGNYSSEHSFVYNLFPTKTGKVRIPSLSLMISGQNYSTLPIDMEIVEEQEASARPDPEQTDGEASLKDRFYMVVSTPKKEVYVGEKLQFNVKLYVSQLPVRNIQFPKLEKNGFTMGEFAQPPQYSEIINGMRYDVADFNTHVYPNRSGELNLGPVTVEASLLYRREGGNDFLGNFFNYQERPLTITAEPVKLQVVPLPEEGQPANFSGAVGHLQFNATVSPAEVKAGDPVTLRMRITGEANFKSIQMPSVSDTRFKTYEPQIKDEEGAKSLEQVLIPLSEKVSHVPAITFNYFDPVEAKYKIITQGPFPLSVSSPAPGQEFKAVGFTDLPQGQAKVVQVDYVQKYVREPLRRVWAFLLSPGFWVSVVVTLLAAGGWVFWRRFRARILSDSGFARKFQALKHAQAGIKQAQDHQQRQQVTEFYDTVSKTLNHYLADHFNKAPGSLTWEDVSVLLLDRQVPSESIGPVHEVFDTCDMARFAGSKVDGSRMSADLAKLQQVIADLEKYLK